MGCCGGGCWKHRGQGRHHCVSADILKVGRGCGRVWRPVFPSLFLLVTRLFSPCTKDGVLLSSHLCMCRYLLTCVFLWSPLPHPVGWAQKRGKPWWDIQATPSASCSPEGRLDEVLICGVDVLGMVRIVEGCKLKAANTGRLAQV